MTKFKGLLEAAQKREPATAEANHNVTRSLIGLRRPPGKRSHPDFEQITAYIRKDTHHAVKVALLNNGRKEFSELVEVLLRQWLKSHN